ncbi:BgTH12-04852 [Blumeria graminis f. sp. triticale]|uniref:BgtE-5620 n=3 Tax=Blumeria graminis TaxID=34373 RepID=A0A9X9L7N4_BLUGR|nr:putative secreted effector protein [Blumeria graminis f. sp. tritici 96224]CAD6499200.1 BgTH12-04852 [Blumeria graminis f. sp. triticale]VCU39315.1 BgtE-5620 [Blumeria graminis f. sp. tritici]
MSCLIAILLYTGRNSGVNNRLVLAYENNFESFHETFTLDPDQKFPELDKSVPIFKTPTTYRQAGTYFATYCSLENTLPFIYQVVFQQLSKDLGDLHNPLSYNIEGDDSCFQHIKSQITVRRSRLRKNKISIKYLEQKICPENVIFRLAYNGRITLISGTRSRAPLNNSTTHIVKLQDPLEIKNYVQGGKFIKIGKLDGKTYSLAWLQGHLHIFLWLQNEEMWKLDTSLGDVMHNRKFAIDFLRDTNLQIKLIMKKISAVAEEYKNSKRIDTAGAQTESKKSISFYNQKCQNLMLEIDTRTARLAEGYLHEGF